MKSAMQSLCAAGLMSALTGWANAQTGYGAPGDAPGNPIAPAPAASPEADAPQPVEFQVGAFRFTRPEGWRWVPSTSPMRKAVLDLTLPEGTAETVFFHFGPGQGGTVEANIQRWLEQFTEPVEQLGAQRAEETINGTRITFLRASGTWLAGIPGQQRTPMPGYGMMGAILESPQGDVYVRMTGPQAVVEQAAPAFQQMVLGAAGAITSAAAAE